MADAAEGLPARLFFHGCISHVIHLAVKDLVAGLPWLQKLEENCRKLVRFFKKHQELCAELCRLQRLEGKNTLVLSADTRLGTIEKCFVSVLESEAIPHAFVSGGDFPKAKTKKHTAKRRLAYDVVRRKDFVARLEKVITLLSVLSSFQKVFERNARPISDVYKMFLQLPATFREMPMPIQCLG
ncbi:hypothetical protein PR003_g19202 [Phytophthora rubi]|uniref:DUF659 domain-containing protein n=1 Tax=Phytophthora rubi TaxID=129364 RepID=A0A6A4E7H3_9STRA|nr:hypothetical protein PR002_g6290 [Phytophthora rubi]KAE9042702.1 hypothetical protein PR001_g6092 [Phytophthora rubi]KAE9314597.1 hypothetical protein PR003_g19202 [Phytophthora rubi]